MAILNHLRHYEPSDELLETVHGGRVLCSSPTLCARDVKRVLKERPTAIFVTVSRKATNFVNEVGIDFFFRDVVPLAHAQFDCDSPPLPMHENLQVISTQNRDKKNGVVNGQGATVNLVHNKTVFLTLPNGSVVSTHLVMCKPDGSV